MQYRIFTDGGSRGNPGRAAIGITIDQENKRIWELGEQIGVATNNVAEYTAVLRALRQCLLLSPTPSKILFFCDSLLVVRQLTHRFKIKNQDLLALAQEAWQLIQKIGCPVEFTHVLRHLNANADTLVNRALDEV